MEHDGFPGFAFAQNEDNITLATNNDARAVFLAKQ
jgi:hypothetical protein